MDKYAPILKHSLQQSGYIIRADPTMKYAVEESGRADLLVLKNGMGAAIEIKSAEHAISLKDLRDNQREWAREFCLSHPYNTPYWIFLIMGCHSPMLKRVPVNYMPFRAWIITLDVWEYIESILPQNALPYLAGKGYNIEMQKHKLDAVHLLAEYECDVVPWHSHQKYIFQPKPTSDFYLHFHR